MIQRIKIDTKRISDIFRYPCITKAYKSEGKSFLVFEWGLQRLRLTDGDCIVQDSNGEWWAEMTTESHDFNTRMNPVIAKLKQ